MFHGNLNDNADLSLNSFLFVCCRRGVPSNVPHIGFDHVRVGSDMSSRLKTCASRTRTK